jgi:hypothetical protein
VDLAAVTDVLTHIICYDLREGIKYTTKGLGKMNNQPLNDSLEDNTKKSRLTRSVLKNYEVIDRGVNIYRIDGAQLFEGRWLMPTWGCDTLQKLIDDISEIEGIAPRDNP